MANKNFTMHRYNGTSFDTLYPETTIEQVDGLQTALDAKQDTLVSGTNIKTINSNSILGSGNFDIDALPSQTGQTGKFLTTNGSIASWANVVVTNTAKGTITLVSGTATYTVTHNLNSRDVIVQIYDGTTYETILADVVRNNDNSVQVTFGELPEHNCVVLFTALNTVNVPVAEEVSY